MIHYTDATYNHLFLIKSGEFPKNHLKVEKLHDCDTVILSQL